MNTSHSQDNTLTVKLQTIDDKVMLSATARENPAVTIDYFPPIGSGMGYTSLELLLVAFGSCVSTTLMTLLRYKMRKTVTGLSAELNGTMREEHPKALKHILLFLKINSSDLTEEEARTALKAAENTMCPVWAMIKGNVTVDVKIEISK